MQFIRGTSSGIAAQVPRGDHKHDFFANISKPQKLGYGCSPFPGPGQWYLSNAVLLAMLRPAARPKFTTTQISSYSLVQD